MDESTRELVKQAREGLIRERSRLDSLIAEMSAFLGEDGGPVSGPVPISSTGGPDVFAGEFHGQAGPRAAIAVLRRVGSRERPHALSTEDLFKAISRGGAKTTSPRHLYTSLFKDRRFQRVGRGVWGLAEWYPDSKAQPSKGNDAKTEPESEEPPDENA